MLTNISRKTVSYILYVGKSGAIGRERVGDYNIKTGVCFRCGTVFVCLFFGGYCWPVCFILYV